MTFKTSTALTLLASASLAFASPQSLQQWSPSTPGAPKPSAPASPDASLGAPSGPGAPKPSGSALPAYLAPPYLNDLAKTRGKYLGTATDQPDNTESFDTIYQSILNDTHIFGQVTPGNAMKGENTEPKVGIFNYTQGDVVVSIAQDTGKLLRCHNLIWVSQQPAWVTAGNWTRETLLPQMKLHIQTLITHWADVCHAWDVVNEAFSGNGSLSASPWLDVIGPDYLTLAFQYAHEAVQATGKNINLYYNDYDIESPGNKTNAVYNLVNELKAQGINICVGLESHFTVLDPNTYANQNAVMSELQQIAKCFAVTELDVRFPALPPNATYSYQAQAYRYWETTTTCFQHSKCEGVTVWDFADKYSWIPSTFHGEGEADLYFANYTRKPAYTAVAQAIQGQPCTVCGDVSQYPQ